MTHGCILVKNGQFADELPNGMLLHTSHTGMHIHDCILNAPKLVIQNHSYIETKDMWDRAIMYNGTLKDWLRYPPCVCALLIAVEPMLLTPVFNNDTSGLPSWSGADDPTVLEIVDDHIGFGWVITDDGKKERFDPLQAIRDSLPATPPAAIGLEELYRRVSRGEMDIRQFLDAMSGRESDIRRDQTRILDIRRELV